jgi:hypothetical protein
MTILLIVVAWTFVIFLVAGLCVAARVGDVESLPRASANVGEPGMPTLQWAQADDLEIAAQATLGRARPVEAGVSALQHDEIAA